MIIDEPKTPFVTEQEFKKMCEEDEDYQREFGEDNEERVNNDLAVAELNMKINMNINLND